MTRRERLLLLAFFGGVLVLLGRAEPGATALGVITGAVVGVLLSGRLRRLDKRMNDRLGGDDAVPTGFALRRPLMRAAVQLVVLGSLFLTLVFVPFVGGELFAVSAAAVTALPAVLTAARLRR